MTDSGPRFCPRCGTARVDDMPFCPKCGLDFRGHADDDTPLTARAKASSDDAGARVSQPSEPRPGAARVLREPVSAPATSERKLGAGLEIPPFVLVLGLIVVGLVVIGLIRLPISSGPPAAPPLGNASAGVPSAPIVGLTILTPADGQAVATKEILVIGTAPPGTSITQDISFGLDQHTTTDGTGHWVIKVGLNDGDNQLKFRIGDDHSTEKVVHVVYQPSG